jgi:hypothetical protein
MQYFVSEKNKQNCTHRETLDEAKTFAAYYDVVSWRERSRIFSWIFGRKWWGYDRNGEYSFFIEEENVEWKGPYYE